MFKSKSSDPVGERVPCLVAAGYVLLGLVSSIVCFFVARMTYNNRFDEIDVLVAMDMSRSDGTTPKSPAVFLGFVVAACVLAIVISIFGCISVNHPDNDTSAGCLGVGNCFIFLCLLIFGTTCFGVISFDESMGPVIMRQSKDFCSPELHPIYATQLACPGAFDNSVCHAVCKDKVASLKRHSTNPCEFLRQLCKHNRYIKTYGTGECITSGLTPRLSRFNKTGVDQVACEANCDKSISCSAYSFEATTKTCWLYAKMLHPVVAKMGFVKVALPPAELVQVSNKVTPVTGAKVFAGTPATMWCHRKGRPLAIIEAASGANGLATLTGIAFVVSVFTMLIGFMWTYTLNTGHKGKKGLHSIQAKMCCPCLGQSAERSKFQQVEAGDYDSEE